MLFPDREQYEELAGEYDLVPVYREVLADLETPVSVLRRFSDRENVFLLESVEGGETWGRYSFVGIDPKPLFELDHSAGRSSGFESLREIYRGVKVAELPGLPRFFGGAVGFVGYEGMAEFERMPVPKPDPTGRPLRSLFVQADCLIVFDNVRHTLKMVVCTRPGRDRKAAAGLYAAAVDRIAAIEATVRGPSPVSRPVAGGEAAPEFVSNMAEDEFKAMVRRARQYIHAGDIIQVVLSQRFTAKSTVPAVDLYRALRYTNPSPYMFFFKAGGTVLAGSSPEVMVRLTGSKVELRPIAGTRPRGATEQADRALADELLADEKEKAEHVMLVDLGRNDLGRVSENGSVQVTEFMVIERYSHVMHIVSHVEGILRKECDACDVIRATFPAGTLSGAPKIRAMQIIHELEPEPRGIYGGAIGYVSYTGNMDMAITIRTMEVRPDRVSVQAGAGIVYDSDPDHEFAETCHKAAGMRRAVALAAGGFEIQG